ncbi:hypothetical protein NMG60_11031068 [Bertholletia excelsa]
MGICCAVCYLKDYERNIEKFKTMYETMKSAGEGLQLLIQQAKRIGGLIPIDPEPWLRRLEGAMEEARTLLEKEARLNGRCFCTNLVSLYLLSKEVMEKMKVFSQLQDEYTKLKEMLSHASVDAAKSIATGLVSKGLETMKDAKEVLKEVDVKKVSVPGLGQPSKIACDSGDMVSNSISKFM